MINFKNFNRKYNAGAIMYYHRINHIFRPWSKQPMCGAAGSKSDIAKIEYVNHWRDCKRCLALYAAEQNVNLTVGDSPDFVISFTPQPLSGLKADSNPPASRQRSPFYG